MASEWLAITLESSYFCEYRLHAKFQLARLCKSWIFEKVPLSLSDTRQTPDTNLNAVVALATAGNQIKLDWAGKLGLGQAN